MSLLRLSWRVLRALLLALAALWFFLEEFGWHPLAAWLGRLMKLVDLDGLDIDEDGSVAGLEAAVAELARDYPELFAVPARKPKARPTGAPRPAAVEKPKSTAEIHANRILGRA